MININYPNKEGIDPKDYYIDKINNADTIYDIHKRDIADIEEYVQQLNNNKLYVNSFKTVEVGAGIYELVMVDAESENGNSVWISAQKVLSLKPCEESGKYTLSFISGRYYDWEDSPQVKIKVFKSDGVTETLINEIKVDNNDIDNFELMCYLDKGDLIIMKAVDQDGNEIADEEINKVFVLNTVLEKRDSD